MMAQFIDSYMRHAASISKHSYMPTVMKKAPPSIYLYALSNENAIDIITKNALFSVGKKGKGLIIVSDKQFRLVLISSRAMKFSIGVQLQAGLNM